MNSDRQWFKARVGLNLVEAPREHAFCARIILHDRVMMVEDTHRDAGFAANPYVTGDPEFRFHAGAPLIDSAGLPPGAVCVLDRQPRQLTAEQTQALEALARQIILLLEFRRTSPNSPPPLPNSKPCAACCQCVRIARGFATTPVSGKVSRNT